MKPVAITSLCAVLSFVSTLVATAQPAAAPNPTQAAIDEAVKRQAWTLEMRQKLQDGQRAEVRGELANAAKLYETALTLGQNIGPGVEAETRVAEYGLTRARLELARQAQRRSDYREADVHLRSALRASPRDPEVLDLKAQNDKLLGQEALRGIPSPEVVERIPVVASNRVQTATLVRDGKLLYEMNQLDEAEAKLKQAAAQEPQNTAAYYYLSLIKEKRNQIATQVHQQVSKGHMVEVEQAWEPPVQRELLPSPNPYARTNLVHTGKGRQTIIKKLDGIRLTDVKYDGLELGEVLRNITDESRRRDPDKTGVNFLIVTEQAQAVPFPQPGQIDPTTGLPITAPIGPVEAVDLNTTRVRISPPLNDVRLADVLDAIIKTADRPLKYSIEDYAVVFSLKTPDTAQLYTRWYKVDPNTFVQGLESVGAFSFGAVQTGSGRGGFGGGVGGGGGGGLGGQQEIGITVPRVNVAGGGGGGGLGGGGVQGAFGAGITGVTRTNLMSAIQAAARDFFIAAGVDLTPPKAVFFNEREGRLLVRATLQDLDIIEQAIQVLNVAPPQINIKTKFVEVTQNDVKALGFDWFLGNFLLNNKTMGAQAGTAPSYSGAPSPANPSGIFPGGIFPGVPGLIDPAVTTISPSISDQLLTGGLRNQANAPAVATLTGILTDPQFRLVIRALEQREGVDLLNAPEVTTMSGRQAQIQVIDIRTIVTGVDLSQSTGGGGQIGAGITGGGVGVVGSQVNFNTVPLPFGPVLDVVPYVSADGFSIQMTIIPTITEFTGYDDPGAFVPQAQSVSGGAGGVAVPLQAQLPLPRFRLRQVTTSTVIWDGQTVVLGGLISEDVMKLKDKVPVLGDLPLLGRFFRSESNTTRKKNLIIFVTPTIIDPAGNRYHSEDEMPFARSSFPPQQPLAPATAKQ